MIYLRDRKALELTAGDLIDNGTDVITEAPEPIVAIAVDTCDTKTIVTVTLASGTVRQFLGQANVKVYGLL